jgi:hypothetical protein
MKAIIEEININVITREDARQIRNELHSLELAFNQDKFPKLWELDRLLAGCFDNMVNGVHIISKK